jgi:uncharacterized protein YcgL (UPF0745 family)
MAEESKLVKKLNKETGKIKIEESDLNDINQLRDKYRSQTVKIGQLNVERILMNQAIERLNEALRLEEGQYIQVQSGEKELITKLQEKYGMGQLNLDSGTFLPVSAK